MWLRVKKNEVYWKKIKDLFGKFKNFYWTKNNFSYILLPEDLINMVFFIRME